jgi:hypothetical protein
MNFTRARSLRLMGLARLCFWRLNNRQMPLRVIEMPTGRIL